MTEQPAFRRVAAVLEHVIADFGRRAAEDPKRLRGLLTDTLGVEGPSTQDAVVAMVAAAEVGLPKAIMASEGHLDRVELAGLLSETAPDQETASFIVEAWITALRVQDMLPTEQPGAVTAPMPDPADTLLPPGSPAGTRAQPDPEPTPPTERRSLLGALGERRMVSIAAAAFVVLGVSGAGLAALTPGDGEQPSSTTASPPSTVQVSATTVVTAEPDPVSLALPEETPKWGAVVNRSWELHGSDLSVVIEIAGGEEPTTGSVWEVFPASLEVDPASVDFQTETVVEDSTSASDPVDAVNEIRYNETAVRFLLELPADSNLTIRYEIAVPPGLDDVALEGLHDEWSTAMETFLATPAPTVEYTTEVVGTELMITGDVTPPGSVLVVADKQVPTGDDGSFEHVIVLAEGTNEIAGRVVDRVTARKSTFDITVELETGPSSTPPTTKPTGNPGPSPTTTTTAPTATTTAPTATTTTTAPPTTTTTAAPVNRAPTVNCGAQYVVAAGYYTSYNFWIPTSCFSDPDGDSFTIYASGVSSGSIASFSGSCSSSNTCWSYIPYSGWDGSAYEASLSMYATDQNGANSASISFTICVNC